MKIPVLILFILFFGSVRADGVAIDSLQSIWTNNLEADSNRFKAMHSFYSHYILSMPDSALSVADYHFRLAESKGFMNEMAEAHNKKAFAHYLLASPDSSLSSLQKAVYYDSLQIEEDKIAVVKEAIQSEFEIKLFNNKLENEKEQAHRTIDSIGSSLRRMYVAFDIKESKYKKISLLMEAMKYSNS